jgi:hypothetical protein
MKSSGKRSASLNGLVQRADGHAVKLREIGIEQHLFIPEQQDSRFDLVE